MKFYIASSFQNKEKVRVLSNKLTENGFEQTYDWTQNEKAITENELKAIGIKEKQAVKDCDLFILLLPGGKGSHIELGIALGSGEKKIYLHTEETEKDALATTFYHLPEMEICSGDLGELVKKIMSNLKNN